MYAREIGRKYLESELEAKRLEREILDIEEQIIRERFQRGPASINLDHIR